MKKLLLGLGTIAAVTAPVVSVVACSSQMDNAIKKLKDGYKDDLIKYGASLSDTERTALLKQINSLKDIVSNQALRNDPKMASIISAKEADTQKPAKATNDVKPTQGATIAAGVGELVIDLNDGMTKTEYEAKMKAWDDAEYLWDKNEHQADKGVSALSGLKTFVFNYNGETEKLNLADKVKGLPSVSASTMPKYTEFESKVNDLANSLGSAYKFDF